MSTTLAMQSDPYIVISDKGGKSLWDLSHGNWKILLQEEAGGMLEILGQAPAQARASRGSSGWVCTTVRGVVSYSRTQTLSQDSTILSGFLHPNLFCWASRITCAF